MVIIIAYVPLECNTGLPIWPCPATSDCVYTDIYHHTTQVSLFDTIIASLNIGKMRMARYQLGVVTAENGTSFYRLVVG